MAEWRDTIRAAKAVVHQTMRVRACYLLPGVATGRRIWVRPRYRRADAGPDGQGVALIHDTAMRVLFDRLEVSMPARLARVLIGETEAYQVEQSLPPYLGFIEADVTRLTESQAAALWASALPEDFLDG